jgi:predicted glycosyltransferase involved in capsule biosynthesis
MFNLANESKDLMNIFGINSNFKDDVSVLIAWRNIGIDRLKNCLRSLRNQDYNQDLIRIILIDYGSKQKNSEIVKRLCYDYNVDYIRVDEFGVWNKSRALNIGIKNSNAKYILISDIDIVFEKNYINECINEMKKDFFQVLYSKMFDSYPQTLKNNEDIVMDYKMIRKRCKDRALGKKEDYFKFGSSICFTLNYFFKVIGGYDEFYECWGSEDADIIKRFELMGLSIKDISDLKEKFWELTT